MAATLLQLRQRCLSQLNDVQATGFAAGNGDRYKIPQMNIIINDVIRFYEKKLNQFYQGYLSAIIPVNVIAGVNRVTLPDTFRSPAYDVRRTLNQVNFTLNPSQPYLANLSTQTVPNSSWLPDYWFEGMDIVFSAPPESTEAAAMTLRYQRKLLPLTTDGSVLDEQLFDAEGCIVIRSSVRLLKSKDVSGALKNIGGWEKELVEEEAAFFSQVGRRYVKNDKPIPTYDPEEFIW